MDKYSFIVALITAIGTALPPTLVAVISFIKIRKRVNDVHAAVKSNAAALKNVTPDK